MSLKSLIAVIGCGIMAFGCHLESPESVDDADTQETISNLVAAGFPENDIQLRDGVVFVVVAVSHRTGEVVSGPDVFARGLASADDDECVLEAAVRVAEEQLERMSEGARRDLDELAEELRIVVRRHLRRSLGSRPVVVPHVLEL